MNAEPRHSLMGNDLARLNPASRRFLDAGGKILIDGQWRDAKTTLPVLDPSTGQQISTIAAGSAEDAAESAQAARRAFDGPWGAVGPADRERLLIRWADMIEDNADTLAELETVDVGMPLWMSRKLDVEGALATIRYMAGWPTKIEGSTADVRVPIPGSEYFGYTLREPVGVVAAIIPWNVPLMLATWKIAPALAAGCTIVVKPSEAASLSVLLLADLARKAGFPDGVLNVVTGTGPVVGEALVRHPAIDKVTFTGSGPTGSHVARIAAEHIKKITLELGGKSPQLIFADANLDKSLPLIANAIFLNSGQICVAGSRLYVQRAIYDETLSRLIDLTSHLKVGPGLDPSTQVGPLATSGQRKRVAGYISRAEEDGATIISRKMPTDSAGFYMPPTIISDARQSMAVAREEVFGPVLTVMPFDDFDEAVTLANDTAYGLAACIWTESLSTAHRVIPRIRSGKVAVNTDPIPHPALPEGGRKASGYGRDLGEAAIDGFLETKSVLIRLT